jgi:hypothetical protein
MVAGEVEGGEEGVMVVEAMVWKMMPAADGKMSCKACLQRDGEEDACRWQLEPITLGVLLVCPEG